MSTVLIIAVGSRGDVAPLTGVGVGLLHAGHDVAIAAYTPFAQMVTGCGLRFLELPADLEPAADVNPMKSLTAFASPSGMRALGNDILTAVADEPADLLLLSPFAEMAGHPLAEALGAKSIGVRLQPFSPTADYPPAVVGGWSGPGTVNRTASATGAWAIDRLYGAVIADFRRGLNLPSMSARRLRQRRTAANWPVLHGYSPHVAPRPADWRSGLKVTGYWWPAAGDWLPPAVLTDFLTAGPPPVFVTFGSMMTSTHRAEQLSSLICTAARRAGVRMIVQAGWAELDVADDDVLTIGEAPHEWLFLRVAAVAHHCGAGTVAAGIKAARPTIALPAYGDGPFWARRLEHLGVSVATIAQRSLTADRLAAALRTAVGDRTVLDNARRLAGAIASEDGIARAVHAAATALHP